MRDIAFLGFFLACLPAILVYPHVGAMLWIWLALASPDEYLFGFMTAIPLSKLVAVLTLASLAVNRRARRFYFDPTQALMLAFALLGLVSAWHSLTDKSINWDLYGKLLKILALAWVLMAVITTRARLQSAIIASVVALSLSGVAEGFKVLLTGGSHKVLGLAAYGDNNAFALAMVMTLPLLVYVYQTATGLLLRLSALSVAGLCVVAVVGTYSRGGFLGLAAFALGLVLLNRNRLRNGLLVGVGALVLMQAAPTAWFDRINTIHTAAHADSSFLERVTAWKISTLIAMDRPLTGGGFHAIQDTSIWLHYAQGLPSLDFIPSAPPEPLGRAAHSIYFEVLGDLGVTGLLLFLGLLANGFHACSRIRRLARGHADLRWAADLAGMLRLSLIVYLIAGAALSMAYCELLYVVLSLIAISQRLVGAELARRGAPAAVEDPWEHRLAPALLEA